MVAPLIETAAFQNYAVAVYQSYFSKYSGQTSKVTGSQQRSPGDTFLGQNCGNIGTLISHLRDLAKNYK